jgi:heterodisulfide reductase subunit D
MTEKEFEPRILAFCCNWCAYAGADLAGLSRIQYSPEVLIVRVRCSGSVDPYFVLRAFEKGFDGVMILGCHPGDCHYVSGNEKAEKRVQMLEELLPLIGIDPRRLKLEWVSASEGDKFAKLAQEFVGEVKSLGKSEVRIKPPRGDIDDLFYIISETEVHYCAECGKCTSICPVSQFKEFSPRVTVGNAIFGFDEDAEQVAFDCVTCGKCNNVCPSVVNFPEFMRRVRRRMLLKGHEVRPSHGNMFLSSARIMSQAEVDGRFRRAMFKGLKTRSKGDLLYFTGCFPLYRFLFKEAGYPLDSPLDNVGEAVANIPRDAVFLMNEAGVAPVILEAEKCCGHDLYWFGDEENFEVLARYNASLMKETGAKRIVCSCPECYWILKRKYPKFSDFDLEVLHISEFLMERVESGDLKLRSLGGEKNVRKKVTFQDPCRLGKYLGMYDSITGSILSIGGDGLSKYSGVYEAPRLLLMEAGFELEEMELSREMANCCGGPNAWINCGTTNKMMQLSRLEEAKATQADVLVTACPKCQVHLKCGQYGEPPPGKDVNIEIKDLVTILAEVLREVK